MIQFTICKLSRILLSLINDSSKLILFCFLFAAVIEMLMYAKFAEKTTMKIGLDVIAVVSFFIQVVLVLTLQLPYHSLSTINDFYSLAILTDKF